MSRNAFSFFLILLTIKIDKTDGIIIFELNKSFKVDIWNRSANEPANTLV